jgi:hypothetical protein
LAGQPAAPCCWRWPATRSRPFFLCFCLPCLWVFEILDSPTCPRGLPPVPTSSPARPDLAAPFPMEDFLLTASLTSPPDRPQWHMSLQPDVAVLSHARELETKTNHVISFVPSPPCGHLPRWSLACTHPQERQRAPPRDCPTPLGGLCGATRRRDQHIPSRAHSGAACRQLVSLPSLQRTPLLGEF